MKHTNRHPHLRIYRTARPGIRQASLDMATIVASLAGLVSAIVFLATMG